MSFEPVSLVKCDSYGYDIVRKALSRSLSLISMSAPTSDSFDTAAIEYLSVCEIEYFSPFKAPSFSLILLLFSGLFTVSFP